MPYENYRAKQTYYHGTWFRSNLEARVAEALTKLGIAWEYETRCIRDERLPYPQYTPDFYLAGSGTYVEVCGSFDERHRANVTVLCEVAGSTADRPTVVVVDGNGSTHGYWSENGTLKSAPARWSGIDGGMTANMFDAVGMRRW